MAVTVLQSIPGKAAGRGKAVQCLGSRAVAQDGVNQCQNELGENKLHSSAWPSLLRCSCFLFIYLFELQIKPIPFLPLHYWRTVSTHQL